MLSVIIRGRINSHCRGRQVDKKFLDFYNQELTFMREMAAEFAKKHPKVAKRLGLEGIDVADPYVERLIEAFCFMSARTQLKLEAEFPIFTQRLLNIVYPNYTSPTPSMGVVQLFPKLNEGDLSQGYTIPRNSAFLSRIPANEVTRCEFRNSHEVTLWPIIIKEARLTSIPPDISDLEAHRITYSRLKGALRLKLKTEGDKVFSQLSGLDRLPIYITGDERLVSHIFEMLHAGQVAMIVRCNHQSSVTDDVIRENAVSFEGFGPDQGLLPLSWNMFHGHNLLHEYFSCRRCFYFFTLNGLSAALKNNPTDEVEIILLLDRLPQTLIGHIDASRFLLYCTPVINLFPRRVDRIEINHNLNDFHIIPDRSRPLDYEVFSVFKVTGQQVEKSEEVIFNPLFQTKQSEYGNFGRYFSVKREMRMRGKNRRKYETRTPYFGTEVFIGLVDQNEAPYSEDIRYLSVEAMVTNRDLPCLLAHSSSYELTMSDAVPIYGAAFIGQLSAPRPPFALGETAWRLIRQLSFNYLPLSDLDHKEGGAALRNMLRLFINGSDQDSIAQVNSLVGCKTEPVVRRLPGNGLLVYGRGIRCILTVDEEGFSGISPYLFGLIMENYLARHAAINIFTETELHSMQRGLIGRWPARPGRRGCL